MSDYLRLYNYILNREHHKFRHSKEYQDHIIARRAYTV